MPYVVVRGVCAHPPHPPDAGTGTLAPAPFGVLNGVVDATHERLGRCGNPIGCRGHARPDDIDRPARRGRGGVVERLVGPVGFVDFVVHVRRV